MKQVETPQPSNLLILISPVQTKRLFMLASSISRGHFALRGAGTVQEKGGT